MKKYIIAFLMIFIAISGFCAQTSVAVINLIPGKGVDTQDTALLTTLFIDALTKTEKFDIMDRQQMDKIMDEQKFQLSDNFNADSVAKIGASLGVKNVIIGEVGKLGETYTTTIRLVDVETKKILKSAQKYYVGKVDAMIPIMTDLANEIAGITKSEPAPKKKIEEPTTIQAPKASTSGALYTACNLWYTKPDELSILNIKTGILIPAGTEVNSVSIIPGKKYQIIKFKTDSSTLEFSFICYAKYHLNATAEEIRDTLFTNKNFSELTSGMTSEDIERIKKGVVEKGMSKQAVLISWGHPPRHKTPSLDKRDWQYWHSSSRDERIVSFDYNWIVSNVK